MTTWVSGNRGLFVICTVAVVAVAPTMLGCGGDEGGVQCPGDRNCAGRVCGPDPICMTSCGDCPAGSTCTASGTCSSTGPSCPEDRDCAGRICGPDPVCMTSCGECPAGSACTALGTCASTGPNCPEDRDCSGRVCGPDPVCSTSCGTCSTAGAVCGADGQCHTDCPGARDCTGRVCGSDPVCMTSCGTCPTGFECDAAGQCTATGSPPCDGCAGDPCVSNAECLTGFLCERINATYAWCSNCDLWGRNCVSWCTVDLNCGTGGVCVSGTCLHACASALDCPTGYRCYAGAVCIPSVLPGINEECMTSAMGWCDPDESDTCIYGGTDPVTDPGLNYCTRLCTVDTDCTDTFVLGCCRALSDGTRYCHRREHCT